MNLIASKLQWIHCPEYEQLLENCPNRKSLEELFCSISRRTPVMAAEETDQIITLIRKHYPDKFQATLKRADEVLHHRFNIHGGGYNYLGKKIDWHLDFKSGRIWKKDFYSSVPLIFWGDYSDAKVPWELSRFHYLIDLAIAYRLSGLKKYLNKYVQLIEDWILENPCPYGINWVNPMEASIRAVNWLASYRIFGDEAFSLSFKTRFFYSLFQHGAFIWNNLEKQGPGISINIYLYDLVGLLVMGRLFDSTTCGAQWYNFAREEIEQEIYAQIGSDGVSYESSLNYHLVLLELFLFAYSFVERSGDSLSLEYKSRLQKSCAVTYYLAKPDQTLPNFGDSGSDRLFCFDDRAERDPRYLWDLAAVLIGLEGFSHPQIRPEYELLWWLGEKAQNRYFDNVVIRPRRQASLYFPISGLTVLRARDSYMSFFANPVRSGVLNGFKHNDLLAIEYSTGGENFVVDSGTYVFTGDPSGRNFFRKTSSHSTLEVDGQEINRFLPKLLFSVRRDAEIKQSEWESNPYHDYISAEHSGYTRLDNPVIVKRSIHFDKQDLIYLMRDDFMGSGKHLMTVNLILDSEVQARIVQNKVIMRRPSGQMAVMIVDSEGWFLEKVPHYVSDCYGVKKESWKIRFSCFDRAPRTCMWGIFGIDSDSEIHEKIARYRQLSENLGWRSGGLNKLTLKRKAERTISRKEIHELFTPKLERLEKEERRRQLSNVETE